MKRYPAYKASETKWIPAIPSHWVVKRLKHISPGISVGLVINPSSYHDENGTVPMITGRNVTHRGIDISNVNNIAHQNNEMLESTRIYAGDLVSIRVGYPGLTAVVPSEFDGINCASLIIIRKSNTMNSYYLSFLMNSPIGMKQVDVVAYGSAQKQFNVGHAIEFVFPVPPLDEQRAIARFLDDKTVQLDQLITQKQQMLELLREERAALINHAVTKGLDAAAPLRDSGVEWLGEVPAHWEVKRLKHLLVKMEQGWSPSCESRPAEPGEWGVLKVGCVNGLDFDPTENKALPSELTPLPEYEINPGDFLISRANTKELVGSAVVVGEVRPKLLLCDKIFRLFFRENANKEYVLLIISSWYGRLQIQSESSGASSSMQNISQEFLKNMLILLPDRHEQQAIVEYVAEQTSRILETATAINQEIALLQEYRAVLIAEAVTGQLDVRHYVPASVFM